MIKLSTFLLRARIFLNLLDSLNKVAREIIYYHHSCVHQVTCVPYLVTVKTIVQTRNWFWISCWSYRLYFVFWKVTV